MNLIYQVLYCYDTFESSHETISVHRTAKGAYRAMKEHRLKIFYEWLSYSNQLRKPFKDTYSQSWKIRKIELKD